MPSGIKQTKLGELGFQFVSHNNYRLYTMILVTADGRTVHLGTESLEKIPVGPRFADSLRKAVADRFEKSLNDESAGKQDQDWAALGPQVVGREKSD